MDPYLLLISVSILIVLSYIFDIASRKLKIPSVLFLLLTGIIINQVLAHFKYDVSQHLTSTIELLGIFGLMVIVLEAVIHLKLAREKKPMIINSFFIALAILIFSTIGVAYTIKIYLNEPFFNSLIYAIPICVVSSAVVLPTVHQLEPAKKEFMIYEATFSDIIGIMFFNFMVLNDSSNLISFSSISIIIWTIISAIVLSYLLVYFFSKIKAQVKVFLMLAIITFLYSLGKQLHFSSLLIILTFGLVLNNPEFFFKGKLSKLIDLKKIKITTDDFRKIMAEITFLVRTIFFIAFGMAINISVLSDMKVIIIGSIIVFILFFVRFVNFKMILKTYLMPEILLSPRGLITILLFYSIPKQFQIRDFSIGILFFVILATSIIMMIGLIIYKKPIYDEGTLTIIDYGLEPVKEEAIINNNE